MHRLNVDIDDTLNSHLEQLPGSKSNHVRIALIEYLKQYRILNAASSQSTVKEVGYNEE